MRFAASFAFAVLVASAVLATVAPTVAAQHAHCHVTITWPSTDCVSAFDLLKSEISSYDHPSVREANYTLISASASPPQSITALHTTPVHEYVDDLSFAFSPTSDGQGCVCAGKSQSRAISILDDSTNFCSQYNLARFGPKFTYTVAECLQHDVSNCDKY